MRRILLLLFAALSLPLTLSAQTEKKSEQDSLVSLLNAKSMELIEKDGVDYRKVTGPAQFLHNNTYLICDTALWNVGAEMIFAIGHVKILQEGTQLTGDSLTYIINDDLAKFRGHVVQLEDKDHNMLRTRYLDYNTKDSVAIFQNGGAMKSSKGDIIESMRGVYDSKVNTFTFTENVNMFSDSVFIKTASLVYNTDTDIAEFGTGTMAWKDDNILSSNDGWFDRPKNIFFFRNDVHAQNPDKEAWADTLFYFRNTNDLDVRGNVEVSDTSRHVRAFAGRAVYTDSTATLKMIKNPALAGRTEEKGQPADTVWMRGDTLVYKTIMMFEVPPEDTLAAAQRLKDLENDAVMTYRKKAAEEAAAAAKKKAEESGMERFKDRGPQGAGKSASGEKQASAGKSGSSDKPAGDKPGSAQKQGAQPPAQQGASQKQTPPPGNPGMKPESKDTTAAPPPDSLGNRPGPPVAADSLGAAADSLGAAADSLAVTDSLAVPKDSTRIAYIFGLGNVKVFRGDFQMNSDSLAYNDLDSLIRLYKEPIVWSDTVRQFRADSIFAVVHSGKLTKASLLSNAFIIMQEPDTTCYDQIRSTEMLAYFDTTTSQLDRFDAMGDANAVFYIKEDSSYATVNKSAAKMLHAVFVDGEIDKVYYFEAVSNDAYPRAQMTNEDRVLKGFNWEPKKRPVSRKDITTRIPRKTQMEQYSAVQRPQYRECDIYYPGYISGIYKEIAKRDSLERVRMEEESAVKDEGKMADSLAIALSDSVSVADSLIHKTDSLAVADSLSAVRDSLSAADSAAKVPVLSPRELKRQQRKAAAEARAAAKEAKWARLDSLDAAKQQAKLDRKAARDRNHKLAAYKRQLAQEQKDNERLERYRQKYAARKAREDARKAKAAEKSPAVEPAADSLSKLEKSAADSLNTVPDSLMNAVPDSLNKALPDSLNKAVPDSLNRAVPDSLIKTAVPAPDSLVRKAVPISLGVAIIRMSDMQPAGSIGRKISQLLFRYGILSEPPGEDPVTSRDEESAAVLAAEGKSGRPFRHFYDG